MRRIVAIALALAVFGSLSRDAGAHGGAPYRGPGDMAPPTIVAEDTAKPLDWETWWFFNKGRYLCDDELNFRRARVMGTHCFGTWPPMELGPWQGPTDSDVRENLLPALRVECANTDSAVASSALIAMARIVRPDDAGKALGDIHEALGRSEEGVKRVAILALGILGASEAIPTLRAIVDDAPSGRRSLGLDSEVPTELRVLAIASIGLIGERIGEVALDELLVREELPADLSSAITVAREMIRRAVRDEGITDFARTIAGPSFRRGPGAGGLSRLLLVNDLPALPPSRKGDWEPTQEAIADWVTKLLPSVRVSTESSVLCAAGLAAAVVARDWIDEDDPRRIAIINRLVEVFDQTEDSSVETCLAVALGLVRAGSHTAEKIYERLLHTRDLEQKGYFALALAMLDHVDSLETLFGLSLDDRYPLFKIRIATALALLGGSDSQQALMYSVDHADTEEKRAATIAALGNFGDRTVALDLAARLDSTELDRDVRIAICDAIGRIAEKTKLDWYVPLIEVVDSPTEDPIARAITPYIDR